ISNSAVSLNFCFCRLVIMLKAMESISSGVTRGHRSAGRARHPFANRGGCRPSDASRSSCFRQLGAADRQCSVTWRITPSEALQPKLAPEEGESNMREKCGCGLVTGRNSCPYGQSRIPNAALGNRATCSFDQPKLSAIIEGGFAASQLEIEIS